MSEDSTRMAPPAGEPDRAGPAAGPSGDTAARQAAGSEGVSASDPDGSAVVVRVGRWTRWRDRIRRNRALDVSWRIAVFVIGAACVLAGVIMLVTPGPGWVAIIVGLAILATEFEWAEGLLRWARAKARAASSRALDPAVRRRNLLIGLAVILVLVALGWWWVAVYGWPAPLRPGIRWLRGLP